MKRFKMSTIGSKKSFSRGSNKIHRKNSANPMRGGIRL